MAKFQEVKVKSKGTMPYCEHNVTANKPVPQTSKEGVDKALWTSGEQIPLHPKEVAGGSPVSIDKSIDRMHADTSGYKSF